MATQNLPWCRDISARYLQAQLEGQPWWLRLHIPDQTMGSGSYSRGSSTKAYLVRPCWPLANSVSLYQALKASSYLKSTRVNRPFDHLSRPMSHTSPPAYEAQSVTTKLYQMALTQDQPLDGWAPSVANLVPAISSERCQAQWNSYRAIQAQEI
ncbi:hypothetical protein H4R34_005671, partial [Dimargaris verticillata]